MKSVILITLIGMLVIGCGGPHKFSKAEYGKKFDEANIKLDLSEVTQDEYLVKAAHKLAEPLAKKIVEQDLCNVVVIEFTDASGETSILGQDVADKIVVALAQCDLPDSFNLIGRDPLLYANYTSERQQDRLNFHERNPELIPILQRVIIDKSIRTAIVGTYVEYRKSFDFAAKLVDIQTGKVYAASSVQVPKESLIQNATPDWVRRTYLANHK